MSGDAKLFSGDIYIDRKDASGEPTGFVRIGAGKLEIKPNVEQKELVSKGRDTYGQVLASVSIPKPADFSIEFLEADRQVLAMALMGQDADISVAAGTVTDEAMKAHLGKVVVPGPCQCLKRGGYRFSRDNHLCRGHGL